MTTSRPKLFLQAKQGENEYGGADHWCDEHWAQVNMDPSVPNVDAAISIQDTILADGRFFEIAYRLKNEKAPPSEEEVKPGEWEVPEEERPGFDTINETINELAPLCCWLEGREKWGRVMSKARDEQELEIAEARDDS